MTLLLARGGMCYWIWNSLDMISLENPYCPMSLKSEGNLVFSYGSIKINCYELTGSVSIYFGLIFEGKRG